jgi:hypothetical protein
MRRLSLLALTVVAVAALTSCNSTPARVYADIIYQVRCLHADGTPVMGCTEPAPRSILGYAGAGLSLSCSIRTSGTSRVVNFSATQTLADGTRTGVSLQGATVATAGGTPSGQSSFTFFDGNRYDAVAGSAPPSAAQPCQISSITFNTDSMTGGPRMDVNVLCRDASSNPATSPETLRGVSSQMDPSMPFTIHMYDCPGS